MVQQSKLKSIETKHTEEERIAAVEIIEGQFWERKQGLIRVRVMAIKDKYAMVRVKGAFPFVLPFSELKSKYNPIPIQSKKSNN